MNIFCRIIKLCSVFVMCIAFPLLLTACDEKNAANSGESEYKIYYKNASGDKLVEVEYNAESTGKLELVRELIEQLHKRQKQSDIVVAKPEYVRYDRVELKNNIANVFFDKGYNDMDNAQEVMYRAALVKTITQVSGIEYVQVYVENTAAQYSNGTPIGLISASDFVDDSDEAVVSVEWKEISLYYTDKLGDKLIKKQETIAYSKNVSLEKMVMEKLIKGPSDAGLAATLPSNLKLLNITVNDGVCYVNLDSVFLTEMVNVSNEIPIYSIVNSLCSLSGINSVRIMINGDTSKTFRESISLDNNFKFNRDLIAD